MDEFDKYRQLWQRGVTPVQIYHAGKADGLDEIALIRLIRTVCGLSLTEAKRVLGKADVFDQKQEVKVGATVYWEEGPGFALESFDLLEGRVLAIEEGQVQVEPRKRTRVTRERMEELPVDVTPRVVPQSAFNETISDRLARVLELASRWDKEFRADLARLGQS